MQFVDMTVYHIAYQPCHTHAFPASYGRSFHGRSSSLCLVRLLLSVRLPQGGSVCRLAVGVFIVGRRRWLLLRPVLFCRVGFPGRRLRAHLLHCYRTGLLSGGVLPRFLLTRALLDMLNQSASSDPRATARCRRKNEIAVGPRNPPHRRFCLSVVAPFALAVGARRAALLRSCSLLLADLPSPI